MHRSRQAKEPFLLEASQYPTVLLLQLLATIAKGGADWMTCNQLDGTTEQSSMVIKSTSLEELTHSESEIRTFFKVLYHSILRYTEIWSDNGDSKSIKLADPMLKDYYHYPELVLVDTKFCVKP